MINKNIILPLERGNASYIALKLWANNLYNRSSSRSCETYRRSGDRVNYTSVLSPGRFIRPPTPPRTKSSKIFGKLTVAKCTYLHNARRNLSIAVCRFVAAAVYICIAAMQVPIYYNSPDIYTLFSTVMLYSAVIIKSNIPRRFAMVVVCRARPFKIRLLYII